MIRCKRANVELYLKKKKTPGILEFDVIVLKFLPDCVVLVVKERENKKDNFCPCFLIFIL